MIKVNILKNNQITNSASFSNQEEADAWIAQESANKSWGESERPELNEMGEPTGETLPAEYSIEQVDIGNEPLMEVLRIQRNAKLVECDWTQLVDAPLDSGKKLEWAAYRQALRDLPEQEGLDLQNPNWPVKPA